ncbi:DUF4232 domain-containing protein [Streptomyces sp. A7024]|uniref:DUF4232 domain-containing protein n=1 Tax=Streptomyces coryli TaxID=1128680 RepID=A0A6G4U9L4_9ACTN|nr:DUF4232 domain-containing protein [Streptomyces coryli]NGN68874.1 DUF4232 domain-containing protein [Streptomyces coryli]
MLKPATIWTLAVLTLATPAVTAAAHAGTPAPHSGGLTLSWAGGTAKPGGTGEQDTAVVTVKNTGHRTQTLTGRPEVVLVQRGSSHTETLREQAGDRGTVRIAPGRSAAFTITFVGSAEPDAIKPDKAVVKLPGGQRQNLPWRWGAVTRMEAATHPGNYTGPLRPAKTASVDIGAGVTITLRDGVPYYEGKPMRTGETIDNGIYIHFDGTRLYAKTQGGPGIKYGIWDAYSGTYLGDQEKRPA